MADWYNCNNGSKMNFLAFILSLMFINRSGRLKRSIWYSFSAILSPAMGIEKSEFSAGELSLVRFHVMIKQLTLRGLFSYQIATTIRMIPIRLTHPKFMAMSYKYAP